MINNCVVIGSGNVATHLAIALSKHIVVRQIYSRNIEHANQLAQLVSDDCEPISNVESIDANADLYILAITDDTISEFIINTSHLNNGIWVHTSGSIDINVFDNKKRNYGVFYPLQTFSQHKPLDMSQVPLFIEGSNACIEKELLKLANSISDKVGVLSSEGRRRIHIAAVFACNFVNYLWTVADNQLKLCGLDIHALDPLIKETINKISLMSPIEAQTGPARRGDLQVIDRHIEMLEDADAELYSLISKQIYNTYHEQN